jgi:hypothetical protein
LDESLQEGANPRDGGGAWLATAAQIENEPGIANDIASKSRRLRITLVKMAFNVP